MKQLLLSITTAAAVTGGAFAGQPMAPSYKETPPPAPVACVPDREWQIDLFGNYSLTGHDQDELMGDHAWGAGLGINYFFARYIGLGAEGIWMHPNQDERDDFGSAGLNLFLRFPAECFVPYIYGGGDVVFNATNASAGSSSDDTLFGGHVGLGIEYRVAQNIGLFTDARYTFVEQSHNDYATVRAGFRFAF